MDSTQDLFITRDILPIFDHTCNDDAREALQRMILNPLSTVEKIAERQQILKACLLHETALIEFQYRKVDYAEAYRFLLLFPIEELRPKDYMTFLFQKRKNNLLVGHYSQLVYFLYELDMALRSNLDISKFPKSYQSDVRFILDFLRSFKLPALKSKIVKHSFGFKSIEFLNALVVEKRKNGDMLLFFEKLNTFEAYVSISKSIAKLNLHFPEITNSTLTLEDMFHPLLEDAIANDLMVNTNLILITGTNMSGKSTFLKTLGLCVYLSHVGFPIPARTGKIPFFDEISIHINHSDDLKNGYSHFMNEIVNLKKVIEKVGSGKRCFAIFDELFKGTNHDDALAISRTTLAGLQKMKSSLFFISTHLHALHEDVEIKDLESYYIDCNIVEGVPIFTYKLLKGWSDLKIGQLLFKQIGLNELLH